MTELDEMWSQMLSDAAVRAGDLGRRHVAEYLRLKASNDEIRTTGVSWLFDTFVDIAVEFDQKHRGVSIERVNPHSFSRGSSNMVGSLIRVSQGVRCLTLEAGWARTPTDGVMQNGALAVARIKHFGFSKSGAEFRFVKTETFPSWLSEENEPIDSHDLRRHFKLLVQM